MMFGTNKQFSLERLPFSAPNAFLSIYQDVNDKNMYLSLCRGNLPHVDRPSLMKITPVIEGEEVPFTYTCTPSRLTIKTKTGTIEFAYQTAQVIRVRVNGVAVRISYSPRIHEAGCVHADGVIEIGFSRIGKLSFVPISGRTENDVQWNFSKVCPSPYNIDLLPAKDGKAGEIAIHEYTSNTLPCKVYPSFDEVAGCMSEAFRRFGENYAEVPAVYKDMGEKAKYMVWHSQLGPYGTLKDTMIYMHKLFINRAYGWQQCFHAMAMEKNVREAWRLLNVFFDYQNECGGVPDSISDLSQISWATTKPPLFGYAVCYILDNFGTSDLRSNDFASLFTKLAAYTKWWFTHRDHSGTGVPAYYHPDESGYDEATLFNEGLPIVAPDLQAYIVMCCEACSRLAELSGFESEAETWRAESKRVLDYLVDTLWDGEQFLAYLPAKKMMYKCGSLAQLQPIMLGSRLPQEIIDILAKRIFDSEEFLTAYGLASENLKSEKLVMRSYTRGAVISPTQMLIINGLYDAGRKESAQMLAIRYLNALTHMGLALGIHSYRIEPVLGNIIAAEQTGLAVGYPFSSWVGSIFLSLSGRILKDF